MTKKFSDKKIMDMKYITETISRGCYTASKVTLKNNFYNGKMLII